LDCVSNWDKQAELAKYRVAALAARCCVTERQLRRYIRQKFHSTPHHLLSEMRFQRSRLRLSQGALVKEVAAEAGFGHQENFSRRFKGYYKINPTDLRIKESAGQKKSDCNTKCPI
jgi:AraC-like DNA-binding protein